MRNRSYRYSEEQTIDTAVGLNLERLRVERSVTRADLAEFVGVTAQQISKYEIGLNRMSVGKLFDIAEYFGVAVAYFFFDLPKLIFKPVELKPCVQSLIADFQAIDDPVLQEAVLHFSRILRGDIENEHDTAPASMANYVQLVHDH